MTDFDRHQAATARWMGYPDAAAMNRDHDPLHRALALWLGVPSNAMRDAAGVPLTREEQHLAAIEEDAVLHLQRYLRHAGADVPD